MSNVVVNIHLTLDGVMQAGRPDEDRRDGFVHGGWELPHGDSVMSEVAAESMANTGAILLGRRTYLDYGFWPHQTDNPFTEVLNTTQKYVASTTLAEPLPWSNSTLWTATPWRRWPSSGSSRARTSWSSAAASWSSR